MTRTRALAAGAVVVAVLLVVAVIASSSGSSDGPHAFLSKDATAALLVQWDRVGDDVSGTTTYAHFATDTPGLFGDPRLTKEAARDVQRNAAPFTGTISGDSVRLRLSGSVLGSSLNGRLDGDALKLVIPTDAGPQSLRLSPASREDFDAFVARVSTSEARRAGNAKAKRLQGDAATKATIMRVATAYQRALAPGSSDDPCRYLSAAAKSEVLTDAEQVRPATAGRGCTAIVRAYESEGGEHPKTLGVPEITLRELVDVASGPLSTGKQADGAQARFPALPNNPIRLILERGRWVIAQYR